MTRLLLRTAAGAAVALAAGAAAAQDEAVPLTVDTLEVTAFPSVVIAEDDRYPCCFPETIAPEGQVLLLVEAVFEPPWTEEVDNLRISSRDIALTGAGAEEPLPLIGSYEYHGFFRLRAPSLSARKPRNWPDESEPVHFNGVFLVPADAGELSLDLGGSVTIPVTVPEPGEPPAPADVAEISIAGTERVDSLESTSRSGSTEIVSTITNPNGAILGVTVSIDPTANNDLEDPTQFVWQTWNFALMYGDGHYAPLIGQPLASSITQSTTNSHRDDSMEWSPTERTLYYAVPADAESFSLYYGPTLVAEF
jgi:hypothetical protein